MLDLNLIPDGGISWLDASGPDGNIVLSTRVRLARNITNVPFPGRSTEDISSATMEKTVAAARQTGQLRDSVLLPLDTLTPLERRLLHERHLVSSDLVTTDGEVTRPNAGVATNGSVGLMINEEDHLRLQCLRSGFALNEAYGALDEVDNALGTELDYAFHPEFGYLTSCPTNAGTGLRASVLIHLPGLVLTKEIDKVLQGLSQVGLTFRGLYGEGSEVVGNFFQLSNQTTLGKSEQELLDHLGNMVRRVVEYEREARNRLVSDAPAVMADKVWRAYGLLRYARKLSFQEMMNLLSGVRLGVGLNLISALSVYTLNKLLIFTQPAHLEREVESGADQALLNEARATLVRELLDDDAARLQ